ncbi:uncharacterized protein LOC135502423 [Lineus longissimus]|uniref:uncharacterized protein LOC135502423 n=1 Tax=Lineus longissimus TaxID=88925 RepID=UPI002B4E1D09
MAHDQTDGPRQSTFLMGLLQALLGFLTVTLYAGIIVVQAPVYISGIGVWGGCVYILAGVLAMFAFMKKTRRFCLWSVISNVFVMLIALAFFAIACYAVHTLRLDIFDFEIADAKAHMKINEKCASLTQSYYQLNPAFCRDKVIEYTRIGMILYILLLLVAVIEFIAGAVVCFMCAKELKDKEAVYRAPTAQTGGQVNKMVDYSERSGAYPSGYPSA